MLLTERLEKLKADLNGLVQYAQKLEQEMKTTHEKIIYFQGAIEGISSLSGNTDNVVSILKGEDYAPQKTNVEFSGEAGSNNPGSLPQHAV